MSKASHHVVTQKCSIHLICEDKKASWLLVTATTVDGEVKFALRDKKMLRQMAKDILEEMPEPRKRKPRKVH